MALLPFGSAPTPSATSTKLGKIKLTNDLGGTALLPTVTATHLASPLPIAQGGTSASTKSTAFDALSPMTTQGDLIVGGTSGTATRLGIGGANTVLHGDASTPTYSAVVEADISLSNNTTNNVSTSKHGFAPILSNNAVQFLNGQGNWTTPTAGVANSYSLTTFSGQTSVNVVHNFSTYPNVQVIDNTGAVIIPLSIVNNTLNDFTVTFDASTSGSIIATVGSPQPQSLTVASGNYTVLVTDQIIKVTGAAAVITLPTAVGNTGRKFDINNASTGDITVNTTSSQTITNQLTQVLPSGSSMTVYSDGANYWFI